MLKIKDNVDLKELEKFGFKPKYDENTGKLIAYKYYKESERNDQAKTVITINVEAKELWVFTNFEIDIIYDLIKDDLIEKVEEVSNE